MWEFFTKYKKSYLKKKKKEKKNICMYLPTPPHKQDMTQGQFLRRV